MTSFTQQIATITTFLLLFYYTYMDILGVTQLVLLSETATLLCYLSWMFYIWLKGNAFRYQGLICMNHKHLIRSLGKQFAKSGLILIMTILTISPVLKTLTEDISSDSIWNMALLCFISNLSFSNYNLGSLRIGQGTSAIALNAAVFSTVILASRLPSNLHVFGLVSFAFNWFSLMPIFRRLLKVYPPDDLPIKFIDCF